MIGFPGSGKTTIANMISDLTGAEHLWADRIRVDQYKQPTYSHEENLQLYDKLNGKVAELLKTGKSVVFDTSFNYKADRTKLQDLATKHGADCKLIWVQTPRVIAKTRATEDAHLQTTRLLGNIPEADFERMSDKLEAPTSEEQPIIIEGIDVTKDIVKQKLGL